MAVYSAMNGPATKEDKCGSMQYNALSSYYTWVARRTKGDAMNFPAIIGSKGDQRWQHLMQWIVQLL